MNRFESIVSVSVVGIFVAVLFGVGWEVGHQGEITRAPHQPTAVDKPMWPPDGTTNPPIKVRGGAMTFYTTEAWHGTLATNVYCTNVPAIDLDVYGFYQLPNGAVANLGTPWSITMALGNNNKSTVQVDAAANDCNGGKTSLNHVNFTWAGNDKFYGDDADFPITQKMRIKNTSCGKDSGKKHDHDEDFCERMSSITIPTGSTNTYTCPDFDCTILIGK